MKRTHKVRGVLSLAGWQSESVSAGMEKIKGEQGTMPETRRDPFAKAGKCLGSAVDVFAEKAPDVDCLLTCSNHSRSSRICRACWTFPALHGARQSCGGYREDPTACDPSQEHPQALPANPGRFATREQTVGSFMLCPKPVLCTFPVLVLRAGVAASFALVGLGTDTGNSVRGPASHTALVGMRPTLGLTSRRAHLWSSLI